jgi:hypothetical protein
MTDYSVSRQGVRRPGTSLIAVTAGFLAYRWVTRGEKGATIDVFAGEA